MAAEVVKIIDPNGGAGYDYLSLNAWETAMQKDLMAADEISIAKCRCTGGTADTTSCTILDWTTDVNRYIKIWTDPAEGYRHNGTYQTGNKYRMEVSNNYCLQIQEENVKVYGIEFKTTATGSGQSAAIGVNTIVGTNLIEIAQCVIKGVLSSTGVCYGIVVNDVDTVIKIGNNIVYDMTYSTILNRGISLTNCATAYLYNNTCFNCRYGFERIAGNVYAKNNNNI